MVTIKTIVCSTEVGTTEEIGDSEGLKNCCLTGSKSNIMYPCTTGTKPVCLSA